MTLVIQGLWNVFDCVDIYFVSMNLLYIGCIRYVYLLLEILLLAQVNGWVKGVCTCGHI